MKFFEDAFEAALWNSRFIILTAVVGSMLAAIAIFYMTTVDISQPIHLVYLGAAIALIALALYLSHAADGRDSGVEAQDANRRDERESGH